MQGTNLFNDQGFALTNPLEHVVLARGSTVPADAATGYARGCMFMYTAGAAGTSMYVNHGDSTSCRFVPLGGKAATTTEKTVATTGNTDFYITVPETGVVSGIDFVGIDALAAHASNYLTFSVTNLGQAGAGTAVLLAATDANTTKTTTGTAISANTRRQLTLTSTAADLVVTKGDRLRVRAAATGTLANTITGSQATVYVS